MKLLTDADIEALNKESVDAQEKIKEDNEAYADKRKNVLSLSEKIKTMRDEIDTTTDCIRKLEIECSQHVQDAERADRRIRTIKGTLNADTRQKSINELVAKQPDFWTALAKEIQTAQDELDETTKGFVTLLDPATAVKVMRGKVENIKDFSQDGLEIRGHLHAYKKQIEGLCVDKVDGKSITIADTKGPQQYLKHVVFTDVILKYWQT